MPSKIERTRRLSMKHNPSLSFLCAVAFYCTVAGAAHAQDQASKESKGTAARPSGTSAPSADDAKKAEHLSPGGVEIHPLFIDITKMRGLKKPSGTNASENQSQIARGASSSNAGPVAFETQGGGTGDNDRDGQTLPLWTFRVRSSRERWLEQIPSTILVKRRCPPL